MPPIKRDSEDLRQILDHHSVKGYAVTVPIFGDAVIINQEGTGPVRRYTDTAMELGSPQVAYVVKPARPFPFRDYAQARHLNEAPMGYEAWMERYGNRTRAGVLPMLMDMRLALESGTPISEYAAEYGLIENAGCMDAASNITCATFWANQVTILKENLKRGMLVEYADSKLSIPGRIVGFEKDRKIVLLEVFTPLPFMETPRAIANQAIRKGFYSSKTFSIGYGLRQALEDAKVPLPPGKLADGDGRQYVLEDLIDISFVEDFCEKHHPGEGHCVWQGLVLYIVPLDLTSPSEYLGKFHPLPERMVPSEYVLDYESE